MNGAEALIRTLVGCGVDVCFANPGTSEMHFVAALDSVPAMRGVLCLFEGVATGAADGYGRMTGRPAAALLHLGPGLANGLANLHNARRARSPLMAIVGDHASYHKRYDAPLESDIDALAGTVSTWVRRPTRSADLGADTAEAVAAARTPPGSVATLILPADVSWSDGAEPAEPIAVRPPAVVPDGTISAAADALRSGVPCVILLGGTGLRQASLEAASRIAAANPNARLIGETSAARQERGAGRPSVGRLAYLAEHATTQLEGARHLILAGARSPASFFAYPGKPLAGAAGCQVEVLAAPGDDVPGALAALADMVAPDVKPVAQQPERPGLPDGDLTAQSAAAVIGALLPEGAIVSDESNTSGRSLARATVGAPPHDWLALTGGAIGQGLPLATGAAAACPDRPVLALESDGSAMYTITALWTHAREQLDITTIIFSNSRYAILDLELNRVGATGPGYAGGSAARDMFDLSRPAIDFTAIAAGMGVPASRASTAADFATQLRNALAEPGPHLIEALIPPPW